MAGNVWDDFASDLRAALLAKPDALVAHLLDTATPAQIAAIAGNDFDADSNVFLSTVVHLKAAPPGTFAA